MVYFIQQGEYGKIKIGYTQFNDAVYRLSQLQIASPEKLRLLGTMDGSVEHEKLLHKAFGALRSTGEWFKPDYVLLHFIHNNIQINPKIREYKPIQKLTKNAKPHNFPDLLLEESLIADKIMANITTTPYPRSAFNNIAHCKADQLYFVLNFLVERGLIVKKTRGELGNKTRWQPNETELYFLPGQAGD